jgi:hypothetical protein
MIEKRKENEKKRRFHSLLLNSQRSLGSFQERERELQAGY